MNFFYSLIFTTLFILSGQVKLDAQTVWTGELTTFTKDNGADWTLEANQDRITENVWLTRANNLGLFNIFSETSDADSDACNGPEPSGTEWAFGTTADFSTLTYQPLGELIGCNFSSIVEDDFDLVLHLIEDDIYIDLKFTGWTSGGDGGGGGGGNNSGGFSYQRSTGSSVGIAKTQTPNKIEVYPNPSNANLKVLGLNQTMGFTIYNYIGTEFKNGLTSGAEIIDISILSQGAYFLKLENGYTIKFIKD